MTETIESTTSGQDAASASGAAPKKRGGGLNSLLIADLKQMAGGMGISGAGKMKKAELVDAIKAAQSGGRAGGGAAKAEPKAEKPSRPRRPRSPRRLTKADKQAEPKDEEPPATGPTRGRTPTAPSPATRTAVSATGTTRAAATRTATTRTATTRTATTRAATTRTATTRTATTSDRDNQGGGNQNRDNQNRDRGQPGPRRPEPRQPEPRRQGDDESGRRNRRRRGRDRQNRPAPGTGGGGGGGGSQRNEPDTTILEDDVLVPAAGILDVLDNYAFVRTSGYLPGADDVYLSLSMVRKFGLRRGDAIVGQVRQPREGERKEKFNPMVQVDSVNGADPEQAKNRIDFSKLTPLYPSERLRLETDPTNLIGRVIDIAAPIGKGQRGLIVSPSKAGKTMIMQSIANSITTNNPECHLMVVLVDERPEEVTDFERSVKGEVISSTFDRPAADHTIVAELAIERAKRLVELGHDVVVLLDGITRLGRAYNLAAPASGRILSGGVDSAALYPPKRFFGAARNIENGGSLTILATALIESGSKMDEVIFEEFKGTGNMEIRLRRDFADKRLFPAIDAVQSGTRREELLMSKEELAIVWKLRRVLSALDGQQALELLLERLKKSQSNIEFLMQVQKTTPTAGGGQED